MAQLDLKPKPGGDDEPEHEPGQSPRSQRRHRQKERQASGELTGRLQRIFDRLAERFERKGDHELAAVIREDSKDMVGGLVAVASRYAAVASPIVFVLGIVEPVLAFGRLFRLLAARWAARRAAPYLEDEPASQPYCGLADCPLGPDSWHVPHEHVDESDLSQLRYL